MGGKRWESEWGWEGGLIMADERVQPIGERLFGLRSEICICYSMLFCGIWD